MLTERGFEVASAPRPRALSHLWRLSQKAFSARPWLAAVGSVPPPALDTAPSASSPHKQLLYTKWLLFKSSYSAQLLAPRGAWLRQKSCQEISCSRSGGIKEVSFD